MRRACVVGSGIAGLQQAIVLSEDYDVEVFEAADHLGGRLWDIMRVYPTFECGPCVLAPYISDLGLRGIKVNLNRKVTDAWFGDDGIYISVGSEVEGPYEKIVIATGLELYDPHRIREYGYDGKYVLTTFEFERDCTKAGGRSVAFINCAGSRDERHLPYCSKYCCSVSLKQSLLVAESGGRAVVFYMDMRADESLYRRAREAGVIFIRARPSGVFKTPDGVTVRFEDPEYGVTDLEFDLVVLSTGMMPSVETMNIAKGLGIPMNEYGFPMTAHPLLGGSMEYIEVAGTAAGPSDIAMFTRASTAMVRRHVEFDPDKCTHCPMLCVKSCPYGAIVSLDIGETFKIKHIPSLCYDCMLCVAVCPSGAFHADVEINANVRDVIITCERGLLGIDMDVIRVPCTYLPGSQILLNFVREGKRVIVIGCHGKEQIDALNRLLPHGCKIDYCNIPSSDIESFREILTSWGCRSGEDPPPSS